MEGVASLLKTTLSFQLEMISVNHIRTTIVNVKLSR